jgi:hypothetical protein
MTPAVRRHVREAVAADKIKLVEEETARIRAQEARAAARRAAREQTS